MNTSLTDKLATFRRQSTDIMTTINDICRLLEVDTHGSHSKRIRTVQTIVCSHYEIDISAMSSRIRTQRFVVPRHIAIYLSRELTKHTLEDIAKGFRPDMDSGTVLHASAMVTQRMTIDPVFATTVTTLRAECVEAIEDLSLPLFAHAKV
jgi:chromosomal replication initiator protein